MLLVAAFLTAGCATIKNGVTQAVDFTSDPPGATVKLDWQEVGKTPLVRKLKRSQSYYVWIELEGYETHKTELQSRVSGWPLANALWGLGYYPGVGIAVVGVLIDTALLEPCFRLTPECVDAELSIACAQPAEDTARTNNSSLGRVYIYRPDLPFHRGTAPDLYINTTKVVSLKNDRYTKVDLEAGHHTIRTTRKLFNPMRAQQLELTVKASHTYYVRFISKRNRITKTKHRLPLLYLVSAEQGEHEIAKCREMPPKNTP